MTLEKRKGEKLQVAIQSVAHIVNDAQTDISSEVVIAKVHEPTKGKHSYDQEGEVK